MRMSDFIEYNRRTHCMWGKEGVVRETDEEVLRRLGLGGPMQLVIYTVPSVLAIDATTAAEIFYGNKQEMKIGETDESRIAAANAKVAEALAKMEGGKLSFNVETARAERKDLIASIAKRKADEAEAARKAARKAAEPKLLGREEAAKSHLVISRISSFLDQPYYTHDGVARGICDIANARARAFYKFKVEQELRAAGFISTALEVAARAFN